MPPEKFASLAVIAILLAACSAEERYSSPTAAAVPLDPEEFRQQVVLESSIDLVPVDFAEWDLAAIEFGGLITVIDFWATWCIPCIERFPHMVEMSNRYPPDQVRFVSVNLDDPGDPEAYISALDFLRSVEARFDHYHITENMMPTFNFFGLQSIPAVSIIDKFGVEFVRLSGDDPNNQFDEEDIEAAIDALLAQVPSGA